MVLIRIRLKKSSGDDGVTFGLRNLWDITSLGLQHTTWIGYHWSTGGGYEWYALNDASVSLVGDAIDDAVSGITPAEKNKIRMEEAYAEDDGWSVYVVDNSVIDLGVTKQSTAAQLQGTVAKWYKALRLVSLVALLSVLVYVGIRIIISSTGQEKAKYKKMIGDWVAAVCILFVLNYIMAFTMDIVSKITDVFSASFIGENGVDALMSGIRANINSDKYSTLTTFTNLIIYLVLVVYTVIFTIHYLKRVVYLAFFTMIAPLIAVTYPIDKIKDGQAQAFGTWIKEYTFNAAIPVIHMIIYFVLVGSAADLAQNNPIYSIVAISFLIPAEKFFKKLFGFDKAGTVSQLGAATGGALIMNAINKMGQKSGRQAAAKAGEAGGNMPRMNRSGYIAAPVALGGSGGSPGGGSTGSSGGSPIGGSTGSSGGNPIGGSTGSSGGNPIGGSTGSSGGSPAGGSTGGSGESPIGGSTGSSGGSPIGGSTGSSGGSPAGGSTVFGQTVNPTATPAYSGLKNKAKAKFNGVRNVAGNIFNKRNLKSGAKTLGRMTRKVLVGAAGATTLGTAGLVAGISTGDFSNAFKYAGAGALAGYVGANKVGDTVINKGAQVGSFVKNNYKEGKWGTDELNTQKSIKELRNDHDFNKTCNQLKIPIKDREKLIRDFYSNGITKSEDIKKAFNVRLKNPGVTQNQIIAAQKIRQQAERDGMKRKDIEQNLYSKGVNGNDLKTAMNLIDQL